MSPALEDLKARAEGLNLEEMLELIAYLADRARPAGKSAAPRRKWREICGTAPYPLVGEDAQAWVSRSRQEDNAY